MFHSFEIGNLSGSTRNIRLATVLTLVQRREPQFKKMLKEGTETSQKGLSAWPQQRRHAELALVAVNEKPVFVRRFSASFE